MPVSSRHLARWISSIASASAGLLSVYFACLKMPVYFGRFPGRIPGSGLIFFPQHRTVFGCGLAGIVAIKRPEAGAAIIDFGQIEQLVDELGDKRFNSCVDNNFSLSEHYLCGEEFVSGIIDAVRMQQKPEPFWNAFVQNELQERIRKTAIKLAGMKPTGINPGRRIASPRRVIRQGPVSSS